MARNYLQGKFVPTRPEKYIGDVNNIQFRSSWERMLMNRCDIDSNILKWNSEEMIVPYLSPVDNRMHRYFVDFIIQMKTRSGEIKTLLVEIKPKVQCLPPKPSRNKKRLVEDTKTYAVNQAKWNAAKAFAKQQGMEFVVLTEEDLGIK